MGKKKYIVILLLLNFTGYCQFSKHNLSLRISLQQDFQKASFKDIQFPYELKEHSAKQINWGLDILTEKEIFEGWYGYMGIGYFRNKFNFKRAYDHKLLNPGTDSIPIGTSTSNYIFNLIRLPVGISYQVTKKDNYALNIGIENIVNFSFSQVYNGTKPFPEANNRMTTFNYYGNSVLLFGRFVKNLSKNKYLHIEPYVRILNIYKSKNPVLYESISKPYIRTLDATGISINYAITFK